MVTGLTLCSEFIERGSVGRSYSLNPLSSLSCPTGLLLLHIGTSETSLSLYKTMDT